MTRAMPGRPERPREDVMAAQGTAQDLHGTAEQRLRRADQRYTAGRRAIVGLLAGAGHPVSIGDIAEGLPSLPRSSAYRHLVCVTCGKVTDVTLPAGFEQAMGTAIGHLADAERFQPHSHRLDILGTCADCRLADSQAGRGGAGTA
jgi:Fe2+ or Zn2+ uptake regulation protein